VLLSGAEVVPNPANTPGLAVVRLELMGSSLSIQGAVANLAGPFRDYTRDPVDDPALNARLTSAVHLHRGARGQKRPLAAGAQGDERTRWSKPLPLWIGSS
jgi:hypothetical protein